MAVLRSTAVLLALLLSTCRSADPADPVPSCPDQTEATDCCCFEELAEGLATYCMPEPPCGTVSGECVDKGGVDCNVDESEVDDIECMLAALQANPSGSFKLGMESASAPFDWSYQILLFGDGAGTVFWVDYLADFSDFSHRYGGVKRFEIASLGLAACASLPADDPDARFDCLRAAFVDGDPVEVCIDPFVQ